MRDAHDVHAAAAAYICARVPGDRGQRPSINIVGLPARNERTARCSRLRARDPRPTVHCAQTSREDPT